MSPPRRVATKSLYALQLTRASVSAVAVAIFELLIEAFVCATARELHYFYFSVQRGGNLSIWQQD